MKQKEITFSMIFFLVIIGINDLALLKTIVWPLFLLLFITSLTIVYIIYVITKYLYEDHDESYEENERIKEAGPFQTKEMAETYSEEILAHWTEEFEKKGYCLVNNINIDSKDEWYVETTVQSIK